MGMHKLFNDDYSGPALLTPVKERPILMSAAMVIGVLNEWKTETRRIVKFGIKPDGNTNNLAPLNACPYGKIGDRLWVRETVACGACAGGKPSEWSPSFWRREQGTKKNPNGLWYRADNLEPEIQITTRGKWKPSIFMPRWASRILLEITEVRIERLQEISEADAIAEGLEVIEYKGHPAYRYSGGNPTGHGSAKGAYWALWESINGKGSWESNPWVWVVKFKRIKESKTND